MELNQNTAPPAGAATSASVTAVAPEAVSQPAATAPESVVAPAAVENPLQVQDKSAQDAQDAQGMLGAVDPAEFGWEVQTGTKTAVQMLAAQGADVSAMQPLLQQAIRSGNVADLDITAFQAAFGAHTPAALRVAQSIVADAQQGIQQARDYVFNAVGGEQQWSELLQAFKQTSPQQVPAVQLLMDNRQFDAAIALMQSVVQSVVQSAGQTPVGAVQRPMQGVQGAAVPASSGLSATEFYTKLQELRTKYPNRSLESGAPAEEYQQLVLLRKQGMQAGR